jgi:hypothetical protein
MKKHRALRPTQRKKERALSAAGIALVRWQVSALPDENAIRQAFAK